MGQLRIAQAPFPQLQIIRYMGNKRAVLPFLIPRLEDRLDQGDVFLDLFAGTGSVGYALKPKCTIYANDVQAYSYVICRALLANHLSVSSVAQAKQLLSDAYYRNLEELRSLFGESMDTEAEFLGRKLTARTHADYKRFIANYPFYSGDGDGAHSDLTLSGFRRLFSESSISSYRQDPHRFPYILFSTYFANGYFGVEQCTQIDSIRHAIDQVGDETSKGLYMTCLISALSSAVSSTGHFAEYRNPTSKETTQALVEEREKSIVNMFYEKLGEFVSDFQLGDQAGRPHRCFNLDYAELLKTHQDELKDVSLVYADPPYTTANYSRFYHVLETLVRYDYPQNFYIGRYRDDRFISGFCKYSTAEAEFERMIGLVASMDVALAISYSSNGIMKPERIAELAERYYTRVESESTRYSHSKQGRRSKVAVKEYLILCSEPMSRGQNV